jgi:nicotinamide phosphoribosyltransferase
MNNNLMNQMSIILAGDSYKFTHYKQYPAGTTEVYSYIESRGGVTDKTLFFGLQAYIKEYLSKPITLEDIDFAETIVTAHGYTFNRAGWLRILNEHGGFIPVEIKAVPEGMVIDNKNVLVTIRNTDPELPWITSFMETSLLRAVWYPTTVATISYMCKKIIAKYLSETADNSDGLSFKLHDFGSRGVNSLESAALGGMAHLVNFMGTDTVPALIAAKVYYDANMAGFSIDAAEHSTITSWTKSGEADAYRNMITQFAKPGSIFAVVSDSYDLWNAVDNIWGGGLLDEVKKAGSTVVIRPDSGDPITIPAEVVSRLMDKVGYTVNSKGYKVLPSHVRVIQGDGITVESLPKILEEFKRRGLSADNIAFGMGGGLLQQVNRDTLKFAMKCSYAKINGQDVEVFKDPATDPGKRSKSGKLRLIKDEYGKYVTVKEGDTSTVYNTIRPCFLRTVYNNRPVESAYDSFETIRSRSNA